MLHDCILSSTADQEVSQPCPLEGDCHVQAAAKAAAAAEAAAAEVSSGAGGLTSGQILEVSPDLLQQDGPITRRMFHMQQDLQHSNRSQKGAALPHILNPEISDYGVEAAMNGLEF